MASDTSTDIAERYFQAWRSEDMEAYRALLTDEADFAYDRSCHRRNSD